MKRTVHFFKIIITLALIAATLCSCLQSENLMSDNVGQQAIQLQASGASHAEYTDNKTALSQADTSVIFSAVQSVLRKFSGSLASSLTEKAASQIKGITVTYPIKSAAIVSTEESAETEAPADTTPDEDEVQQSAPVSLTSPEPETASPETEPEPTVVRTAVNETVYAATNVWLRSDWSDDPVKYVVLEKGDSITRVAVYDNGWSGLSYDNKEVFVKTEYLSTEKPAVVTSQNHWEYSRTGLSISIDKVVTSSKTYFVAKVYTENPGVDIATLFSGSAGTYNSCFSAKETCSTMAKRAGAIFAINGDSVGTRGSSSQWRNTIVIRNGKLWYEDDRTIGSCLAMKNDGELFVYKDKDYTGSKPLDMGVINTWWFDDVPLVINGEVIGALRNGADEYLQPRTAIGQVDKNNFLFIVCDGRGANGSEGIGYKGMARLMVQYGAYTAYILDGGGFSTMYFDGQVINRPCNSGGAERALSDIIYVKK